MKNKYTNSKLILVITLTVIGLLFYILNHYTPLYADDYSYSFSFFNNNKITSFSDILLSQKEHYLKINGRIVVHTIAQGFLYLGNNIFDIINTFIFLVLGVIIYFHSYGTFRFIKIEWIIIIFIMLWVITPNFGQSYLWITGASNYLYGITIILIYLMPFRVYKDNDKKLIIIEVIRGLTYLLLGVLAGCTNENTSSALIIIEVLYLIKYKIQKIRYKPWMISGLLGSIIGFLIMLLAPGQQLRLEFSGGFGDWSEILRRIAFISIDLMKYFTPMIITLVVLIIYYFNKNNKKLVDIINDTYITIIFLIGTIASIYSMILSPSFPERAWSGPTIFFIITIGSLYSKIEFNKKFNNGLFAIIMILLVFCSTSYLEAITKLRQTRYSYENRVSAIISQQNNNKDNIYIPIIVGYSKYDCYSPLGDLSEDSSKWPNTAIAKYYGVKSINIGGE